MAGNVKYEYELYAPMRVWFQRYLEEKYIGSNVIAVDTSTKTLDTILANYGVIDQYPHIVGLDIQIDILGIITNNGKTQIAFIEAKKTQLNLHHLGQLWAYCRLCDPIEAFLLSSEGLGCLSKILGNLGRQDLLNFGDGKKIKQMRVGKWDISNNNLDYKTLIPKM